MQHGGSELANDQVNKILMPDEEYLVEPSIGANGVQVGEVAVANGLRPCLCPLWLF